MGSALSSQTSGAENLELDTSLSIASFRVPSKPSEGLLWRRSNGVELVDHCVDQEWRDSEFFGESPWCAEGGLQSPQTTDLHVCSRNEFAPNMILEATCPSSPDQVRVCRVVAVRGEVLQLRVDGQSGRKSEFVVHHASPEIQPLGTCRRTGRTLYLPKDPDPASQHAKSSSHGLFRNCRKARSGRSPAWCRYARLSSGTAAPESAFIPPYYPEHCLPAAALSDCLPRVQGHGPPSLFELSGQQFLSALQAKTFSDRERMMASCFEGIGAQQNAKAVQCLQQDLQQFRTCGWCTRPFLTGYRCVDLFTKASWLEDAKLRIARTASTCSQECARQLVYRRVPKSNCVMFKHDRHFFLRRNTLRGGLEACTARFRNQSEAEEARQAPDNSHRWLSATIEAAEVFESDDSSGMDTSPAESSSAFETWDDMYQMLDPDIESALQSRKFLRRQPFRHHSAHKQMCRGFRLVPLESEWDLSADNFSPFICWERKDNDWNDDEPNQAHFEPPTEGNKFRVGHRFEAVDRRYPHYVCVASVKGISGDRVLVHFDGWSRNYDFFCRHDSPEIRPVGTAANLNMKLEQPRSTDGRSHQWAAGNHTWEGYLAQIGAEAAPEDAFGPLYQPQKSHGLLLSLQEICLRTLLCSLREETLDLLDDPDCAASVLELLPNPIRQAILASRMCNWCGGPYLLGYNCVMAFSSQHWLASPAQKYFRLATTCSRKCAEQLTTCKWESNRRNDVGFIFPRLFFVAGGREGQSH